MKTKPSPLSSRDQEKLLEYLKDNFTVKDISGDEVKVNCPRCPEGDEDGHLWINKKYGFGHCFKCDWAPSFRKKLRLIDKSVSASAFEKAAASLTTVDDVVDIPQISWPDGIEFLPSDSPFGKLAMSYLEKTRKFDAVRVCERYKLAVCSSGRMMGRIIFPIFEEGKLVYYQGRSIFGKEPTYLNPPKDEKGRGKSEYLFNLDVAAQEEIVFLVEGFFDAMRMGDSAIPLLGKTLSETQLEKLILAGIKRVCVCLDTDAKKESLKVAEMLSNQLITYICWLSAGDPDKMFEKPSGSPSDKHWVVQRFGSKCEAIKLQLPTSPFSIP